MDLYREEILEHWQNPQNFGVMGDADVVIEEVNPVCGDEITMYFKFSEENLKSQRVKVSRNRRLKISSHRRISHVSFTSSGCAISTASASILSEAIKNKSIVEISNLEGKDVLDLIGADRSFPPARLKCAFLVLEAVRKIADKSEVRNPKYETISKY